MTFYLQIYYVATSDGIRLESDKQISEQVV